MHFNLHFESYFGIPKNDKISPDPNHLNSPLSHPNSIDKSWQQLMDGSMTWKMCFPKLKVPIGRLHQKQHSKTRERCWLSQEDLYLQRIPISCR